MFRDLSDYPRPGVEPRLIQRFASLTGKRVLEIGCGEGRLTLQVAPLAGSVVALDPDPTSIKIARRGAATDGVTNVFFHVGSAQRMRFGGGPFDIALFSWSL